jgi:heme/copper-type cytochrome/quinol oxidase subunit 1
VAEPDEVADAADAFSGAAAAGLALLSLGVLLTAVSLLGKGRAAADDPWAGQTLEWAAPSPPPVGNFASLGEVTSAEPLLDERPVVEPGAG